MKRTLIVAAIILAVGIPAAITANRYWSAADHRASVKTTGGSCPVQEPAGAVPTTKDGASCPYLAGKTGDAATKSDMPVSEPAPTDKAGAKCPVTSASPAPSAAATKPATKATVKPPVEKKVESAVCPVMKTRIPDVTKAAGHSIYNGKTYYFCCAECKPLFDKNPSKYVKQ